MAANQDEGDLETFQRLSDNYQTQAQGPLIRDKLPIRTLMDEFNNADSTYITKIDALATSYSMYRPIRGDGQCGWRAVIFGYFESLLFQGMAKIASEQARIESFNESLVTVGYDYSSVEFFVDETMDLFGSLYRALELGRSADQLLFERFNQEDRSNLIVVHFRLLTTATMKLNPNQYQPYLVQPLSAYCQSNIDAFGQEIEQIGLQALTDGVIAPARINVIVMYLDRSQVDEVTRHHFVEPVRPDWPTITLLYRPGHYDMIYKAPPPMQVHRAEISTGREEFMPTSDYNSEFRDCGFLSMLNENHSMVNHHGGGNHASPSGFISRSHHYPTQFSPQTHTSAEHSQAPMAAVSGSGFGFSPSYPGPGHPLEPMGATTNPNYHPYTCSSPRTLTYLHPPMVLPLHGDRSSPATSPVSPVLAETVARTPELQIRMSQPCYDFGQRPHETIPLETNQFKNSAFNRGHFANPDFQPLIWSPEGEA